MVPSSQPDFDWSSVERLLQLEKFDDALELISNRLLEQPHDRAATLYRLLASMQLHGPEKYEPEVNRLRSLFYLKSTEKELLRRIFLVGFRAAEQAGLEPKTWAYQRLLRRLLTNQPLTEPIPVMETPVPAAIGRKFEGLSDSAVRTAARSKPSSRRVRRFRRACVKKAVARFALSFASVCVLIAPFAYLMSRENLHSSRAAGGQRTARSAVPLVFRADGAEPGTVAPSSRAVKLEVPHDSAATKPPAIGPQTGQSSLPPVKPDLMVAESEVKRTTAAVTRETAPREKKLFAKAARKKTHPAASEVKPKDVIRASQRAKDKDERTKNQAKSKAELGTASTSREEFVLTDEPPRAYKTRRPIRLRERPRFSAPALKELSAGASISIVAVTGDWLKVRAQPSGMTGYLRREYITPSLNAH